MEGCIINEDWIEVVLGEVCIYSKGKKPKLLNIEYSELVPFPYINIKAFEKGIFDEYTDGVKCNLCEDGDLLMVWDGARAGFTGKAKKGAIGSTLMKIEPKGLMEKNFLFYFLQSLYKKLNTNPRGVGIPHVEPRLLWNSILILPPLPIQRAIVSKIESLFTSLDKGIADLKTAQDQLKIYRQAVLKKAFEGEYSTKEYAIEKIDSLCNVVRGGSPRPAGSPLYYDGPIPFMKVKDISRNSGIYVESTEHSIKEAGLKKTRLVDANTLLLTNSGATLGIPAITKIKTTFNDGIAAFLDLGDGDLLYHYYYWVSKTIYLRNLNQGAAQPNLNTDIIGDMEIPIYRDKAEHIKIVREIESRLSVCDKVEESIKEALLKSEALRQSILKKAFEGKLLSAAEIEKCKKVKDYEPASVLLERIRKEKGND